MTVDMQSTKLPTSTPDDTREPRDSVDCGAPWAAAGLEDTILKLSETLTHLQRCAQNDEVQAVCGLLAKAQGELIKVSARDDHKPTITAPPPPQEQACEGGSRPLEPDDVLHMKEDLALIQSIPTANLLNTCFEVHAKRQVNDAPDRCSTVSTMSSLGGYGSPIAAASSTTSFSPRISLASQRDTLPCTRLGDVESMHLLPPSRTLSRFSLSSPRPSLPGCGAPPPICSGSMRAPDLSVSMRRLPCFTTHDCPRHLSRSPVKRSHHTNQRIDAATSEISEPSPRPALFEVEHIGSEESDDWELEFLRKSQLC